MLYFSLNILFTKFLMILESSTTRIVFCEYTSAGSILDDVGNGAAGAGVTGAGAAAGAGGNRPEHHRPRPGPPGGEADLRRHLLPERNGSWL